LGLSGAAKSGDGDKHKDIFFHGGSPIEEKKLLLSFLYAQARLIAKIETGEYR
jgi:hypothetical protein